ncbi:MAG: hypothetical protein BroJett003_17040 [Planctomycetota bacterium]|nr:MAG: hypothetical protein BroJett003_17040 [Planctomycetota bacterium]
MVRTDDFETLNVNFLLSVVLALIAGLTAAVRGRCGDVVPASVAGLPGRGPHDEAMRAAFGAFVSRLSWTGVRMRARSAGISRFASP